MFLTIIYDGNWKIVNRHFCALQIELEEEIVLYALNQGSSIVFKSSGDTRVNQQPMLASMHTVWVREHNRVARGLAALHPEWDNELLYQVNHSIHRSMEILR